MAEYITICQNRIAYDLGILVAADLQKDGYGDDVKRTDLVELGPPFLNSVGLRMFDAFMVKAAETTEKEWTLKVAEFAALCGMDLRTARRQMKMPCAMITSSHALRAGYDRRLFCIEHVRGGYRMEALDPFWKYAQGESTRGVMPFPKDLFKVNMKRTPMAYLYGRTLVYHKFMNLGKTNEDIIRVESICDHFGYDKKGGAFKRRLLEPFIRNMDALSEILSYEWLDGLPKNYEYFLRSRLKITWHDYPYDLKYIAKRQRRHSKR